MKLDLPYALMTTKEFKEFVSKTITKYELEQLPVTIFFNAESKIRFENNFDVSRQVRIKAEEFVNLLEDDSEAYKNVSFYKGSNFWLILYTEIFLNNAQDAFVNTFEPFQLSSYLKKINVLFRELENVHFTNSYNLKIELKNMRNYLQTLAQVPEFVKEQIIRICSNTPVLPLQSEDLKLYYHYMESARAEWLTPKLIIIFKAFKVHEGISSSTNSNAVLLAAPLSVIEYADNIYGNRYEDYVAVEETDDEAFYENVFSLLSSEKGNPFTSLAETIFAARNI